MVGLGSVTDSLSAVKELVFEGRTIGLAEARRRAQSPIFEGRGPAACGLVNRTHKIRQRRSLRRQAIMLDVFNACFEETDGRPDARGGRYRVEIAADHLSHLFRSRDRRHGPTAARPGFPLSEGISPVQGADRHGPPRSSRARPKMDHVKTGGTLLNMKFSPGLVSTRGRARQVGAPGPQLFQDGRASRPVQRRDRRDSSPCSGESGRSTAT